MEALPDEELSGLTDVFRQRLKAGETLDDILPEAFAAMCEADKRTLGMYPFDVQILAGIALHKGYLAQMCTGEGKTLTATLPLYLNAIEQKGAFLVTNNEYLALRDSQEMGPAYEFMGLTIAAGVKRNENDKFDNKEKKEIYDSDIVYTTHSALGFDYLINNLVKSAEERFLRDFNYIIVDEADSVMLDSANTPLVISGAPRVQSNLYDSTDFFVSTLEEDRDYEREDKSVWFTEEGLSYAEDYFGIENIFDPKYFELYRHLILALRANLSFTCGEEYVVSEENEVALVDKSTGRMLKGVKLRGGQHQALECKEKVKISQENRSMASVTYQNFFCMFPKLSGMSGTIYSDKDELLDVYGKEVAVIPTNHPKIRKDMPDLFFRDSKEQFESAIALALEKHEKGQPVLFVTTMISDTEVISQLLVKQHIPHSVLNANNAFWEAEIIKEAGQPGAMTVATSMAGRGTDIKLGPGVKELGGLVVIGVGRMQNVRDEMQARGRAGRQGDPGYSQFFVSLEDDIVEQNSDSEKMEKIIESKFPIPKLWIKHVVNDSQRINEEHGVSSRKSAKDYDIVLQKQRGIMYDIRNNLLDGGTVPYDRIIELVKETVNTYLQEAGELSTSEFNRYLLDNISYTMDEAAKKLELSDKASVVDYVIKRAKESYAYQQDRVKNEKYLGDFIRVATLNAIDDAWIEQVDYLQQLKAAVSGRNSAQRNPLFEYQAEALESFYKMEKDIKRNIVRNIMLSEVRVDKEQKVHIILP